MDEYKIIILPSNLEQKKYNGIIFKTNLSISNNYVLELIKKFSESEDIIFEKNINYTLDRTSEMDVLLNFLIQKYDLKSIKVDLFFKEMVPFMIPETEIKKLKF